MQDISLDAAYVATIGIRLPRLDYPNGYTGASGEYAPYTLFDQAGNAVGGFGALPITTNHSHSSYHSLQTSVQKNSLRAGLGFQASYTFGKSIEQYIVMFMSSTKPSLRIAGVLRDGTLVVGSPLPYYAQFGGKKL